MNMDLDDLWLTGVVRDGVGAIVGPPLPVRTADRIIAWKLAVHGAIVSPRTDYRLLWLTPHAAHFPRPGRAERVSG